MGIILSVLQSCKSVSSVESLTSNVESLRMVDTIILRDSVYRHDSIIYRERTVLDTVYITKEVYRDRLEARGERLKAVRTDTVVVKEYRYRVVEHPPKRYVPKFYKGCAWALGVIVLLAIGYWLLKWRV